MPWTDESAFIIPATSFYRNHNFAADQMLMPEIFWMPFHLYFVNGLFFSLLHSSSLAVSRALSFIFVTAAAVFLRSAVRSALASDLRNPAIGNGLVAAWYISLPIVFCANLMRPDALSVCLSTATIALALRNRNLATVGIALACIATHPLEAFPAVSVAVCVLPLLLRCEKRWWEWPILIWGAGLFGFDTGRDIKNVRAYRLHMTLQVANKQAHQIPSYTYVLLVLLVPLIAWTFCRALKRPPDGLPNSALGRRSIILVYTLACISVTAYAREMWYFIWELVGFTLLFALMLDWLQSYRLPRIGHLQINFLLPGKQSVALSIVIFLVGLSTWIPGFRAKGIYGFYVNPAKLASARSWMFGPNRSFSP